MANPRDIIEDGNEARRASTNTNTSVSTAATAGSRRSSVPTRFLDVGSEFVRRASVPLYQSLYPNIEMNGGDLRTANARHASLNTRTPLNTVISSDSASIDAANTVNDNNEIDDEKFQEFKDDTDHPATNGNNLAVTDTGAIPQTLAQLKNFMDTHTDQEVANYLRSKTKTPDGEKTRYQLLDDKTQKGVLNYSISKHPAVFSSIVVHGILGYVGELFYLYWDYQARIKTVAKLFPSIPDDVNFGVNLAATFFITEANITYSPLAEARSYMLKKMLEPEKAFLKELNSNRLLTLCFALYAFGGGYVEVDQIDEELTDAFGPYLKFIPIVALVYAAVAYYTAYSLNDTIEGFNNWLKSESLFLKAFNPYNGEILEDRYTAGFVCGHEFLTLAERVIRMAYGGYQAGNQQDGQLAGIIAACLVGAGTVPVALGTRVMATERHYYDPAITPEMYAAAQLKFNELYAKSPLKEELYLFLTPSVLLVTPPAFMAYLGVDMLLASTFRTGDPYSRAIISASAALVTAIATHVTLGFRYPAKRRTTNLIAKADIPVVENEIVPNQFTKWNSTIANITDTTSRLITFVYVLMVLFPDIFDDNKTNDANRNIFIEFCITAFISLSAYRYQDRKVANALVAFFPSIFGEKPVKAQALITAEPAIANRSDYENLGEGNNTAPDSSNNATVAAWTCFGIFKKQKPLKLIDNQDNSSIIAHTVDVHESYQNGAAHSSYKTMKMGTSNNV
jgi:hypothetical protein